jgi:hypothetical protein
MPTAIFARLSRERQLACRIVGAWRAWLVPWGNIGASVLGVADRRHGYGNVGWGSMWQVARRTGQKTDHDMGRNLFLAGQRRSERVGCCRGLGCQRRPPPGRGRQRMLDCGFR